MQTSIHTAVDAGMTDCYFNVGEEGKQMELWASADQGMTFHCASARNQDSVSEGEDFAKALSTLETETVLEL